MIFTAIQRWINNTFSIKMFHDPVTDQIIFDREQKQLSYSELSKKYKKSKEEIKKIWYNYLGLRYFDGQLSLNNLPSWVEGLEVRPAFVLVRACFKSKKDIIEFIKDQPKRLMLLDNVGNKFMKKILDWLEKN